MTAATARRRYAADDAPHLMMPSGFRITMGGIGIFFGLLAALYWFYYSVQFSQTATQTTLAAHSTQIEKLSTKADAVQKEIYDNATSTSAKLSELHEQSTVANNNQETIRKQLEKIGQQLDTLSLASAPARR